MLEKEWAAIVYNKTGAEFALALTGRAEVTADPVALQAFRLAQIGFGMIAMTDEWPGNEQLDPMPPEAEDDTKITAAKEVYNFFVENLAKDNNPKTAVLMLAPYGYVFGCACLREANENLPKSYMQASMQLDSYLQTQQGRQSPISFNDALTNYKTVLFKPNKRQPGNTPE